LAGDLPQTTLGELRLQRSPDPITGFGGRFRAGLGKRRKGGVEGRGKGGPQVTVEPGPLRALLRH